MQEATESGRRRVNNACLRCRKHKIKCSGSQPCKRCHHRGLDCSFGVEDKKVTISASALQELKNKIHTLENQQETNASRENRDNQQATATEENAAFEVAASIDADDPPQVGFNHRPPATASPSWQNNGLNNISTPGTSNTPDLSEVANPLVGEQPMYLLISGRLRNLGHSSTWSFTQKVLQLAGSSPHAYGPSRTALAVEGNTYTLPLEAPTQLTQADMSGLPPCNLSLYYLHNVKFRMGAFFHLYDEHNFTSSLRLFYDDPLQYAQLNLLWFVHFLVMVAFGKALVAKTNTQSTQEGVYPGSQLFTRALRLLPNISHLALDPVESSEVLCAIALYLQSIDHRCAAYLTIGQALRLAQSHGLHADLQVNVLGDDVVNRCRRIWWTTYILDRKFSASMGVANSVRDEDITAPLPPVMNKDEDSAALLLYVKVCQLQGKVITSLYGFHSEPNTTFVKRTCAILKDAAGLSDELRSLSDRSFGDVSRVAAHVGLVYHQCVLVASRPVLYHALKQRLEGSFQPQAQAPSSTMKGLIQICIDSATQIVTILSQLQQHDLLDGFLPFDLEAAASAGLALVMALKIHPKLSFTQEWFETITHVLDNISAQGNLLAKQRKAEIEDLYSMLNRPPMGRDGTDAQAAVLDVPEMTDHASIGDPPSFPSLGEPFFDDWNLNQALSGGQLLEVAAAMDAGSFGNFELDNTNIMWPQARLWHSLQ